MRENYRSGVRSNNSNIDRIIIGYRVRTRVVETVYITEHDPAAFGRFRFDRTFEISCELIQALQNPQLDLTSFLIQMGYYVNVLQGIGEIPYSDPSAQQTCSVVQNYSGSTATTQQQQLYWYPSSYEQHVHYSYNTSAQSGPAANYRKLPGYSYWKLLREGKPAVRVQFSFRCKSFEWQKMWNMSAWLLWSGRPGSSWDVRFVWGFIYPDFHWLVFVVLVFFHKKHSSWKQLDVLSRCAEVSVMRWNVEKKTSSRFPLNCFRWSWAVAATTVGIKRVHTC